MDNQQLPPETGEPFQPSAQPAPDPGAPPAFSIPDSTPAPSAPPAWPPAAPAAAPGQPTWVKTLFALFFVAFVVGGLYFGYLFYVTVREVTAYYAMPQPVVIPTQPAPPVAQGAQSAPPVVPTPTVPLPPTAEPDRSVSAAPVWNRKGRTNILLLGTDDGRECVDGVPRTDTIILVSIDPEAKRAYMVSIPRDLWVEIPSRGIPGIPTEQRINTAYTFGEINRYPGGGAKLARDTVERNFGVPIHYHAIINLENMEKIIDILGGVEIEVKQRLYDNEFPDNNCGYKVIDFKPGTYTMTGQQAMDYARSRHTTSDFDRADRQQQVLLAIRRKALQPDIITKIPALIGQYRSLVKTDMSPIEMLALANVAKDIDAGGIQRYTIGVDMVLDVTRGDGARVLYPDRAKIKVLFDEIFRPKPASN